MRRGTSYGAKADHGRAFGDLDKAIELDPKNVEDHLNRSALYGLKADRERALVEVNKAIEIKPRLAAAYIARANIYLHLGNNEHAVTDASKAIELDPKRANGFHIRKRCLFLYSRLRSLDLRQHRGDRDRSGIDGRLCLSWRSPRAQRRFGIGRGLHEDRRAWSKKSQSIQANGRAAVRQGRLRGGFGRLVARDAEEKRIRHDPVSVPCAAALRRRRRGRCGTGRARPSRHHQLSGRSFHWSTSIPPVRARARNAWSNRST